jgi:hypothetical protein
LSSSRRVLTEGRGSGLKEGLDRRVGRLATIAARRADFGGFLVRVNHSQVPDTPIVKPNESLVFSVLAPFFRDLYATWLGERRYRADLRRFLVGEAARFQYGELARTGDSRPRVGLRRFQLGETGARRQSPDQRE